MTRSTVSRRHFIGTSGIVAAGVFVPDWAGAFQPSKGFLKDQQQPKRSLQPSIWAATAALRKSDSP